MTRTKTERSVSDAFRFEVSELRLLRYARRALSRSSQRNLTFVIGFTQLLWRTCQAAKFLRHRFITQAAVLT